jgi:hypothetical protein
LQPWIALRQRWPDEAASSPARLAEATTVASTSVPVFTVTDVRAILLAGVSGLF